MSNKRKIIILTVLSIVLIAGFLFMDIGSNWEYILKRRAMKLISIVLTGAAIAFATVVFQTITNNRILTPSIIGMDSLYMLVQTLLVFSLGANQLIFINSTTNYLFSVGSMVLFALLLYQLMFRGEGRNIYFLLLIGIILGTLFSSMSSFLQVLIDPNEFLLIQDRMFASFNNVKTELLNISLVLFIVTILYAWRFLKYLDVLALGREHAINLGVDHAYVVKRLLIVVAILIAIATALVGPITFLGLLVANVSYELMKTYKHSYLIPAAVLISIIALAGGQLIVERVFTFSTTVSVIINLIGGIYFLYLLLKENRTW
ncbi:iron chelate uptake ABC transporter family permease subunit [Bacillaceae bacterium Marseille-Q3522]|nr:iron chelate uptake ABC transporter family permease subunit [Bacillaceae bacterium Marseille-Q3522]